ncbi:MAG TPA: BA14K family protein [Stellaceae bacterium]|nr:BA14K family protein [Stellaceae bacterium]
MGENASPSGAQNSERTGTQGNRQARSASGGERINSGRTSASRERLSSQRLGRERPSLGVNQQGRVGVAAGQRVEGGTFGYGQRPQYYDYAPGMRVAGADRGAIAWCATRFQSFDPATGTYMGFDGIRHPCP